MNKTFCAVCGGEVSRPYYQLCQFHYAQYGKRAEWPAWLLDHVRALERERKATATANKRNRILDDEYSGYSLDGARRAQKTQTETPSVKIVGFDGVANIPDALVEHVPSVTSPRDPHAPFERITARNMAVERLPAMEKRLYYLHWKGYKQSEIARMMNISQGEVSKRLSVILNSLHNSVTLE